MTIEERNRRIRLYMKEQTEKLLASPKEEIMAYLVSLGIYTPEGKLTKEYGGED